MTDRPIIIEACITEYKGHSILNLPNGSGGFGFGLRKAQMIIAQWENILSFVETNGVSTKDQHVSINMWKNKPTLCLNPDDPFKFQFQIPKAVVILEHEFEINKFVESNGKEIK